MRKPWFRILFVTGLLTGCTRSPSPDEPHPPRVVLMIGDGMGVAMITAARIHSGALQGLPRPVSARLTLDEAPRSALVRTWSEEDMTTDSAAAMTAMVTGRKTRNGMVAVLREGTRVDTLETLLEIAEGQGLSTGIVTTTSLTHATPAACYSHLLDRDDQMDIAPWLLPGSTSRRRGDGIEVAMGGGSQYFLPRSKGGKRPDDRDLTREFQEAGYEVVWTREEVGPAVASGRRILGLFASEHLSYEADQPAEGREQPSLEDMVAATLEVVSRNPKGFLLIVEGGRIDHALHDNNAYRAVIEMLAFDATVERVLEDAPEGTIVLVTGDHDHTMVIAGYVGADRDVFTLVGEDLRGNPYSALLFGTGSTALSADPGASASLVPGDPDYRERAAVPLPDESHGAMDVPLYLWGPREVLDRVPASLDNTGIFQVLRPILAGG
jgi:alkaline phosphatase